MSKTDQPAPPAEPWLRAAQGFGALFWGLALALALLFGALRIEGMETRHLPRHTPALLLIVAATIWLGRSRHLSAGWSARNRALLWAGLTQLYLLPFFRWWQIMPQVSFFGVHMAVLLLATAWLLLAINLSASEMGRAAANPVLVIESRLCGWSVLLLSGFLLALGMLEQVREALLRPLLAGHPLWVNTRTGQRTWWLLHVLISLPFLLTMATAWEARREALRVLLRGGCPPAEPRVP